MELKVLAIALLWITTRVFDPCSSLFRTEYTLPQLQCKHCIVFHSGLTDLEETKDPNSLCDTFSYFDAIQPCFLLIFLQLQYHPFPDQIPNQEMAPV